MDTTTVQKLSAEAIGTFVLVLLGCGAAVSTGADIVATGFAFGISVLIMAFVFGRVSGGHFNPAVTVGAAASGRFAWKDVPSYVGAQLGGSIVAAFVLWVILKGVDVADFTTHGNMGQTGYGDASATHLAWWAAFLVELIFTAIFIFVILGATDERNPFQGVAPIVIGLTLAILIFTAIHLTGGSFNPARSIGPALFAGGHYVVQQWLFIVAPLAGAFGAGVAYPAILGRGSDPVLGSGLVVPSTSAAPEVGEHDWVAPASAPVTSTQPTGQVTQPMAQDPIEEGHTVQKKDWKPERIIQDGWEWDYEAQQWKPAEEPPA